MKIVIYIFISYLLLSSCNNGQQNKAFKEKSDLLLKKSTIAMAVDTTITYNIEGISSEGAEAKAKYIASKIKECVANIYGEHGQVKLTYLFEQNQIKVIEAEFRYKAGLENVKHEKDLLLKKEIKYVIDLQGHLIGNADKDRVDIFHELQTFVPFELNK